MTVHVYVYENTETTLWFESLVVCEGGPWQLIREYDKEIPDPVGPGGTTDYNQLSNRPQINSVLLSGNKTSQQLKIEGSIPPGGTAGQVLTKKSATDGDADWQTPTGGATSWDQITGKPTDLVQDASYVHTDNNYTTSDKEKLESLENYDDTALAARVTANETSIADRYTKAEADALLADKADKATTYTKTETDALIEGEHIELTQAQYTALPEEEKNNGKVYFITDGGAYVPAVDLIPYVNQAPIVVGKFDLRGDGEFRDIKRVRLWISDLKNCSTIITVGWPETGVYIRTLRVYGAFTLHKTISGEERIFQYPIPYTAVGYDGAIQFSLNFYVNNQNKLIMDIPFKQSVFHQDDFAQVIIDYIETPIT